jgi:hypothetical protein
MSLASLALTSGRWGARTAPQSVARGRCSRRLARWPAGIAPARPPPVPQKRRRGARQQRPAALLHRPPRGGVLAAARARHLRNAGFVDDEVTLPERVGEAAANFMMHSLFSPRCGGFGARAARTAWSVTQSILCPAQRARCAISHGPGPPSFPSDRPLAPNPSPSSITPPKWPDYRPVRRTPDTNRQARAACADLPWRSPGRVSDPRKRTARRSTVRLIEQMRRLFGPCWVRAASAHICRLNRLILADRGGRSGR